MLLVQLTLIVFQAPAIMANVQCVMITHPLAHTVMANNVILILFVPLELVLKVCVWHVITMEILLQIFSVIIVLVIKDQIVFQILVLVEHV